MQERNLVELIIRTLPFINITNIVDALNAKSFIRRVQDKDTTQDKRKSNVTKAGDNIKAAATENRNTTCDFWILCKIDIFGNHTLIDENCAGLRLGIENFTAISQFENHVLNSQVDYYKAVISAIFQHEIRPENHQSDRYYTVNVPLKLQNGETCLVRIRIEFERSTDHPGTLNLRYSCQILGNYEGSPLMPRVYHQTGTKTVEQDLPRCIRKEATSHLRRILEEKNLKFPFTPRQMELLEQYHLNPGYNAKEAGEAMKPSVTEDTSKAYGKAINKRASNHFRKFDNTKQVAKFWYDQGFGF